MKVVFLGTNGWYNTDTGNTTSVFVETDKYYIIFDAGDGLYKIDRYIKDARPIYIFISHLHLDHISGLHILNKFNFKQGIKVYGETGTKTLLKNIIQPPYSLDLSKLPYKVEFIEIGEGRLSLDFSAVSLGLVHPVPCLGYRMELDNKTIAYCLDTGPCDNVITLAKDADLFITECSLKSGQDSPYWPHLNAELAAGLAKRAGARRLAITHFNPFLFPALEDRKIAEGQAKAIFPDSFCCRDGLEVIV